jgi:phosphoribosyl-ATP pyrophosphohydrolase
MEKGDMSLKQLKKRLPDIRQWAEDRNLIAGSTTAAQFVKLVEEAGEMLLAHENDDPDGVKDGAGDVIVVLTILAAQIGANLEDHIKFHDGDGYIYGEDLLWMDAFGLQIIIDMCTGDIILLQQHEIGFLQNIFRGKTRFICRRHRSYRR